MSTKLLSPSDTVLAIVKDAAQSVIDIMGWNWSEDLLKQALRIELRARNQNVQQDYPIYVHFVTSVTGKEIDMLA